jgi:hypothetical protein
MATFEALVAEGAAVPVDGWDFSWFAGRATEQRPSWRYARLMGERMARARRALDLQTGGGEVLAGIPHPPPELVATEDERRALVWTDETAVPNPGPRRDTLLPGRVLLIRPQAARGLQPADLDEIEAFTGRPA